MFESRSRKREESLCVGQVLRTDRHDLQNFLKLVNAGTYQLFGPRDPEEVLCKSHVSLCIETCEGDHVGYLCFNDYPNVPAIPPWDWRHWLHSLYALEGINSRNCLWIDYAVWDQRYTYSFLRPMLRQAFASANYLEYVLMIVPPGVTRVDWMEAHGTRILPTGFAEARKVQTLYLIVRQHFVTKYKIRRAVEEDNDDIVPLIHANSEMLRDMYGEFYVAELITRHADSGRQLIVAEHDGVAVAVLSLNQTVNYDSLEEQFELIPFYGLRKVDDRDFLDHYDLVEQASIAALPVILEHEESQLSTLVSHVSSKGTPTSQGGESLDTDEVEIKCHKRLSEDESCEEEEEFEDSEDYFSIVDVSSVHLLVEGPLQLSEDSSEDTKESQYSAYVLSYNEYEMHLYMDKSNLSAESFNDLEHLSAKVIRTPNYAPKIPFYHGPPNAFSLELVAALPEHEKEALTLLLEAAFECFGDRDYCVLSFPSTCPPQAILDYFCRAVPRPVSTYPHELYILHRNTIMGKVSTRTAERKDMPQIRYLIKTVKWTETLITALESAVNRDDSPYKAYVLFSQDDLIGLAVLKDEEDVEYLRTHYQLHLWMTDKLHKAGSHGVLESLILTPIFKRHAKFFLRELHRLSDYSAIFYCLTPADAVSLQRDRSIACTLSDLLPVQPRVKPEFSHRNLEGCEPADVVHRVDDPIALYLSTARHCSFPRIQINTRIVVVGASNTALAFLEALLCGTSHFYQVTFTDVTVVSPHGLNYQRPPNRVRDMLFVTQSNMNHRWMHQISLRTYINVVNGVMTSIDRKNKTVKVNNDSLIPYDMMFLFCGEQYLKPTFKNTDKKWRNEFPENVFFINTETDAFTALTKLKGLINETGKTQYTVIVYGHNLDAYCCLAALVEYGVPGGNIAFVEPFPVDLDRERHHNVSFFNDGEVDEAVKDAIQKEGIVTYYSYYFIEWYTDAITNRIYNARFESKFKLLDLECIALFIYNEKSVSSRTFYAINHAGLVFDGGIVISSDCHTNDPDIYAAGTLTKYSRRYYADHMAHKYFNLEEIGYKLGKQIRAQVIPVYAGEDEPDPLVKCDEGNMLVPRYSKPLVKYCQLPGNIRYLSVTKPGKSIPLETAMGSDDYGKVLITGDHRNVLRQGYFRLHINKSQEVETITCLGMFDIDRINLTSLWGKHERLLNNVVTRFEMVTITDLFEYFKEPWSCAIYHDLFPTLEQKCHEVMTSLTSKVGESLVEDLVRIFKWNGWEKMTAEQRVEIAEKFKDSPYDKLLEQNVLDFLLANLSFLPMYAHPFVVKCILQGYENSPMFQPQ